MGKCKQLLNGSSLLEAIVAAVIFLMVFAAVMELIPRLGVSHDNTLVLVEADRCTMQAFSKYATGEWPDGAYSEAHDWGELRIRLLPHPDFPDLQSVEVAAHLTADRKTIRIRQWIAR